MSVAAADDHAHAGEHRFGGFQLASVDVGVQVVDGDQWQSASKGERFCRDYADQERSRQAWRVANGDGVQIVQLEFGIFECLVDYRDDSLNVGPSGDFWHDAVELLVQIILRGHHAAQDFTIFRNHSRGSLVAGGLDAQDFEFVWSFHGSAMSLRNKRRVAGL